MSNTAPHKVWMLTAQLEGQHHVTDQEPDESKRHIYIEYIRADIAAERDALKLKLDGPPEPKSRPQPVKRDNGYTHARDVNHAVELLGKCFGR